MNRSVKIASIFLFREKNTGFPPISSKSEETLLCRRKSLAIFDGRGRKEKSSIFLFPERKIEDSFYRPMKWVDKKNLHLSNSPKGKRQIQDLSFLESEEQPSPQIPKESEGTRDRRNGRPLRFQRNLRGPGIGRDVRLPKIACDFRETAGFLRFL